LDHRYIIATGLTIAGIWNDLERLTGKIGAAPATEQ